MAEKKPTPKCLTLFDEVTERVPHTISAVLNAKCDKPLQKAQLVQQELGKLKTCLALEILLETKKANARQRQLKEIQNLVTSQASQASCDKKNI